MVANIYLHVYLYLLYLNVQVIGYNEAGVDRVN